MIRMWNYFETLCFGCRLVSIVENRNILNITFEDDGWAKYAIFWRVVKSTCCVIIWNHSFDWPMNKKHYMKLVYSVSFTSNYLFVFFCVLSLVAPCVLLLNVDGHGVVILFCFSRSRFPAVLCNCIVLICRVDSIMYCQCYLDIYVYKRIRIKNRGNPCLKGYCSLNI